MRNGRLGNAVQSDHKHSLGWALPASSTCLPVVLLLLAARPLSAPAAAAPPVREPSIRTLFDFEDDDDRRAIAQGAQGVTFDVAQDNGVTQGTRCCRMTFRKGGEYREIHFGGARRQGWEGYDYFAMDVTCLSGDRARLQLELWDDLTRDYFTRCTHTATVVPGKQTVLIPIRRSKRNGKEGRDWQELEPADKIRLHALKVCKLFLRSPADHDLVWWVDNIRLLKEDALGRRLDVELPPGALAFNFGRSSKATGFLALTADARLEGQQGLSGAKDLTNAGKQWPDPLSGTSVFSPSGAPYAFETPLPDGQYLVWLAAGQVLRDDIERPRFLLKVGNQVLHEDAPSPARLHSETYFFRFMRTPYSQREHALWLDFIDRMYPVHRTSVRVRGGRLRVELRGYSLAALIVVPATEQAAFDRMAATIRRERIRIFEAMQPPFAHGSAVRKDGDGPYVCFVPDPGHAIMPDTSPTPTERACRTLDLAAAPGQNVCFRVAVTPFEELGECRVSVTDLAGPGRIAASAVRWYYKDYRLRDINLREEALVPAARVPLEPGVSRVFWAWLPLPSDTPPGHYSGTVSVAVGAAAVERVPLDLTVYPFRLADPLPYSFGMWYRTYPTPDPAQHARVLREQLAFMRAIGFTGVQVAGPGADGTADPLLMDLAIQAGMGRHPMQMSQAGALGMGRAMARRQLGLGARVDQEPGCELDLPAFKGRYVAAASRYAAFLEQHPLPMAVQSVDEPREVPNPWNRNLEDTNRYADYLREAGVPNLWVTALGDKNGGRSYASLLDHHDIVAVHAARSSVGFMTTVPARGKPLWLYNVGMDRLSWGFYNWRAGSTGRWEWHFCWVEGGSSNGYLNDEWYNPFTARHAFAPRAPYADHAGAMLFSSSFLTCAEGITDTAYLVTLERAIRSAADEPSKAEAVAKASALLEDIRNGIPLLPPVRGLSGADTGALVGRGVATPSAALCEMWRRRIAEQLLALR